MVECASSKELFVITPQDLKQETCQALESLPMVGQAWQDLWLTMGLLGMELFTWSLRDALGMLELQRGQDFMISTTNFSASKPRMTETESGPVNNWTLTHA